MSNQKQSAFWSLNYTFGVAAFTAFCAGTIGFYSALGLSGLRSMGVKAPVSNENVWKFGAISYYTIIAGTVVGSIAVAAAYVGGTIAAKKEYRQKLVEDSYRRQDKALYTPPSLINNSHVEEKINAVDNTSKVHMFRFVKNEAIASKIANYDSLIVLGDVSDGVAYIAVVSNEQVNLLMDLFDCLDSELVGKAFTSHYATAEVALRDFLERQVECMPVIESGYTRDDFDYCVGCVNFRPGNSFICPLHKEGWYGDALTKGDANCPDRHIVDGYPMAPYEDYGVVRDINKRIKYSGASISINDDGTLLLWDDVTNRRFEFDWFGKRQLMSDYLAELPGNLEAYIEYYSKRNRACFIDYTFCVDDLNKKLKGIGTIEVVGHQREIHVTLYQKKYDGIDFVKNYFNRYGYPLYPYKRRMPVVLEPTLIPYIEYFTANSNGSIQKV